MSPFILNFILTFYFKPLSRTLQGYKYFYSINNWLEVTLYVMTVLSLVRPRNEDRAEMGVCVFLVWVVLLHYISKWVQNRYCINTDWYLNNYLSPCKNPPMQFHRLIYIAIVQSSPSMTVFEIVLFAFFSLTYQHEFKCSQQGSHRILVGLKLQNLKRHQLKISLFKINMITTTETALERLTYPKCSFSNQLGNHIFCWTSYT